MEREVLQSSKITVVDFWDEYCSWCNKFYLIYEEIAAQYKDTIKFTELNMKESPGNRRLVTKYEVIGKPTLKFFVNGRVIGEAIGVKTKGRLKKVISDIIEKQRTMI